MKRYLLTTVDNPFDPVEEYELWMQFDHSNGYYTDQRLARVCPISLNCTDAENQRVINGAVDDFIRLDENGIYKRVVIEE